MVKTQGKDTWSRHFVKTLGQDIWSRHLVKMVGQFIWSGHMVKTLGKDTWSRYFSRKLVMTLGKDGFLLRCLVKTHFQLRQQLLQGQIHFMCHLS